MQLVGYISQCNDHESVIVTDMKPEQNVTSGNQRQVYTKTAEVYSTAVKCHSQGVPAILYVDNDEKDRGWLVATDIDPIDLTEDDVKERLDFLRHAIDCADRNVHVLAEHVEEIVNSFLSAFTHYRHFNEKYQDGYSGITSANYHAEQLKEIISKEKDQ